MTAHCSAALMRVQPATSASVRRQPLQYPSAPIVQTLMQGEVGPAVAAVAAAGGMAWQLGQH